MQNIILIGMPGCGKTTVGKALAKRLHRPFFDTDEEFFKTQGITPGDYIKNHGEADFRRKESEIVAEVGKKSGAVIATGGGVPTVDRNYDPLHQNGMIIFLTRPLECLATKDRPLSTDLSALYEKRLPLYLKFADYQVENRGLQFAAVKSIVRILDEKGETK